MAEPVSFVGRIYVTGIRRAEFLDRGRVDHAFSPLHAPKGEAAATLTGNFAL
jgi:hypothetical protein